MADLQCPLAPHVIDSLPLQNRMNLSRVMEIEKHVLSAGPCIHPPLADLVLHCSMDGSTPLLLACEEDHLDAVDHIVKEWGSNVRAASTYYHRLGEKTEKATPIFVAALRGHIQIVDYLISKNADVSAVIPAEGNTWYGGLTPLYGALRECRPGQSYSEKFAESSTIASLLLKAGADPSTLAPDGTPVWMAYLCGADATIALVNHGLDVKQLNLQGETMLHHWIQFSSTDYSTGGVTDENRKRIIKLLIDKGADLQAKDSKGFTPILVAAESNRFEILDLLLENDSIDRNDKIDALELAGALLLSTNRDNHEKAGRYWRQALQLRGKPNPINKVPLQMNSQSVIEWVTSEDLENIMQNPSVYCIQELLTRLRIYSYKSCKAVQEFVQSEFYGPFGFFEDLDGYYSNGILEEDPIHIEDLLMATLGVFLRLEDPYGPMLWELTQKLVDNFTSSLSIRLSSLSGIKLERIDTCLQLIFAVDPDRNIPPSYDLVRIFACLPSPLSLIGIREYLSQSVQQSGGEWLVQACHKKQSKTIRLLLHLGADPNTRDNRGNWCLHIVAGQKEDPREDCTPAQLLFDYGAQPFAINNEGKSAVQLWMEKNCGGKGMQSTAWNHRPHWCRDTVPKLSSLTAKTIHTHGINYSQPGNVPVDCILILETH